MSPTFSYTSGNPSNLVGGTAANMTDIQGPFTDLGTFLNGQVGDSNLSASAAIQESKLAPGSTGLSKGAFAAWRTTAASVATGAQVPFDVEEFDVSSWYNNSTSTYQPLVAGYYRLSWCVTPGVALGVDVHWQAQLHKNGSRFKDGSTVFQRGSTAIPNSLGTAIVQANGTTDAFTIVMNHGNGVATALLNQQFGTYFGGELIGRS